MLVSSAEMLIEALKGRYAVGQFNLNNLEWTIAILKAAAKASAPVILGVTEAASRHMGGLRTIRAMVGSLLDELKPKIPVALHLDHATESLCLQAIGAGFTSVMFDGSKMPIEENLQICQRLSAICRQHGISLEAELGSPAGKEDGIDGTGAQADINECASLARSGITSLAVGIGNMHGAYPPEWKGLNLDLLKKIREAIPAMPLVLHGGTGIDEQQLRQAIEYGICKINVNTECQMAFSEALRKYFDSGKDRQKGGYGLQAIMGAGMKGIEETVGEKIRIFGSAGQGRLFCGE